MGRMLVALLLGTGLLLLSSLVFGSGTITRFYEVVAVVTNMQHGADLVAGTASSESDVVLVIKFIIEVFVYYLAAAVLTFVLDLFMPGEKKKDAKK
jgi:hypothetical protein